MIISSKSDFHWMIFFQMFSKLNKISKLGGLICETLDFFLFSKDYIIKKKLFFQKNKYTIIMIRLNLKKSKVRNLWEISYYTWNQYIFLFIKNSKTCAKWSAQIVGFQKWFHMFLIFDNKKVIKNLRFLLPLWNFE